MSWFLNMHPDNENVLTVSEESFDLDCIYARLTELVKHYEIKYAPEYPVPHDDALADRVFQAAVDFFIECGAYVRDVKSVFRFTRQEVLEAIADYRGQCKLGEGKEARSLTSRKPDSAEKPWQHVGSGIVTSTEEIASQIIRANASIASADSMSVNALNTIEGRKIISGQPSEIIGAIRSIKIAREACRLAGRPGLPIINGVATAGCATATIATANPAFGWRTSDGVLVGSLAECKTSWDMMAKVVYCLSLGCNIGLAAAPMLGGYCGGPEGTAVVNAAYAIWGMMVYKCDYYLTLPLHINHRCSTTRDVIWAMALSVQAIARNTTMPTIALAYAAGGPMTDMFYKESAAFIAAAVASGASIQTPHPARAVMADYVTPLDMKTTVDMILACTGMTRKEAGEVLSRLLPMYEDALPDAPVGMSYSECYDLSTATVRNECIELVAGIKKDLRNSGVPLK